MFQMSICIIILDLHSEKNECIPVFEEKNNSFSLERGEVTVFIFWNLPEGVKL